MCWFIACIYTSMLWASWIPYRPHAARETSNKTVEQWKFWWFWVPTNHVVRQSFLKFCFHVKTLWISQQSWDDNGIGNNAVILLNLKFLNYCKLRNLNYITAHSIQYYFHAFTHSVFSPVSSIQYPVSSIQYPVSSIQYPVFSIQSRVQWGRPFVE